MKDIPDILKKIMLRKVEEITARAERLPLRDLAGRVEHGPATRGFTDVR
jgi:indole-3-glycerol phosphate synthase